MATKKELQFNRALDIMHHHVASESKDSVYLLKVHTLRSDSVSLTYAFQKPDGSGVSHYKATIKLFYQYSSSSESNQEMAFWFDCDGLYRESNFEVLSRYAGLVLMASKLLCHLKALQ